MENNLIPKKKILQIIILAAVCTWLLNIFVGRYLTAKISTLPILNKWNILSPQAPIVINNREIIRESSSQDLSAAINGIKSKLSTVVNVAGDKVQVLAGAINLTTDGYFVTANVSQPTQGNLLIVLGDGRSAVITQIINDPATGLVFLKADIQNVPVGTFGKPQDLLPGQQIIFTGNSLQSFTAKSILSSVAAAQNDVAGQIFSSDFYSRAFAAQPVSGLFTGQAVINSAGEVVGLWNGAGIASSDVIGQESDIFFNNNKSFYHPTFNFKYQILTKSESVLASMPEGAKIVEAARPAGLAKTSEWLEVGDIITAVNGEAVNQTKLLETKLANFKPGSPVEFSVWRSNKTVTISLTPGVLK